MQIDHGGVDAFVSQKVFDGDDVQSFFQKVGGEGMPQGVHAHILDDARIFGGLFYRPLYAPLGIAAIKITACPAKGLAVKKPGVRLFGCEVGFKAAYQDIGQGHIAVFFAFALAHVQHLAVKVQITDLQVAHFKTPQATAVEQAQQHAVFEQFGGFQYAPGLLAAQHYGQLLFIFQRRQLQALVLQAFHAVHEAQAVDGELEKGVGNAGVLLFYVVEVIAYLVRVKGRGHTVEMQGQFGQVVAVVF